MLIRTHIHPLLQWRMMARPRLNVTLVLHRRHQQAAMHTVTTMSAAFIPMLDTHAMCPHPALDVPMSVSGHNNVSLRMPISVHPLTHTLVAAHKT